jgi:hypothetical protein
MLGSAEEAEDQVVAALQYLSARQRAVLRNQS